MAPSLGRGPVLNLITPFVRISAPHWREARTGAPVPKANKKDQGQRDIEDADAFPVGPRCCRSRRPSRSTEGPPTGRLAWSCVRRRLPTNKKRANHTGHLLVQTAQYRQPPSPSDPIARLASSSDVARVAAEVRGNRFLFCMRRHCGETASAYSAEACMAGGEGTSWEWPNGLPQQCRCSPSALIKLTGFLYYLSCSDRRPACLP